MKLTLLLPLTLLSLGAQTKPNLDLKAEEAAIRAAIPKLSVQKNYLKEHVYWNNGTAVRPVNNGEQETPDRGKLLASKGEVQRLEVAASGDMAYEFSKYAITREITDPGQSPHTIQYDLSLLRIWKKVGGKWMVAAHLGRPHN